MRFSLAGRFFVWLLFFYPPLMAEGLDKIAPSLYSRLITLFEGPASTPAKDGRYPIRIALYIHPDLIHRYSRGWTHAQGKAVENGAQFVVNRFLSQLQHVNTILNDEGFNAAFYVYSVQLAPLHYPDLPDRAHYEFAELSLCYWGGESNHALCQQAKEKQGDMQYNALAQGSQQGADIFIYLRDKRSTESRTGLGYPGVGAVILDNYHETVWENAVRQDDGKFVVPLGMEYNVSTLLHELGHVMGIIEHDLAACASTPSVMSSRQVRARSALSFSPVQATGECAEQAAERRRRIEYTVSRLPLNRLSMAGRLMGEKGNPLHTHGSETFTWRSHIEPNSKKLVITLDSQTDRPVTISWLAADETAWEGRDFWFGLQLSELPGKSQGAEMALTLPASPTEVRTLSLWPVAAQGAVLSELPSFSVTLHPDGQHEVKALLRHMP